MQIITEPKLESTNKFDSDSEKNIKQDRIVMINDIHLIKNKLTAPNRGGQYCLYIVEISI